MTSSKNSNRVLFLDIDGPMIPGRAYDLAGQSRPFVMKFDPVAVSIVNGACSRQDRKIVIHSSWIRPRIHGGSKTYAHCVQEGLLEEYFHKDAFCDENEPWRYTRIHRWLQEHPETDDFVIVDDTDFEENYNEGVRDQESYLKDHILLVDFDDGLLMRHWRKLRDGSWKKKNV